MNDLEREFEEMVRAILSYVFYREMRSLNKAIKDIDEFREKNN